MNNPYFDYSTWLADKLPYKVQKLPIDIGLTCPNRDGSKGRKGCIFCNNKAFSPMYCDRSITLTQQINKGKDFFARKGNTHHYLAYLQSYTNTYCDEDYLKGIFEQLLNHHEIVGLVVATRPDSISPAMLDFLEQTARQTFLIVELGIESANDETLRFVNRGHDFQCSKMAVENLASRNIFTCGHVILGLPGEEMRESIRQAPIISSLPLSILKIHQMQVFKDTPLAEIYASKPFQLYDAHQYIALLCEYIQRLRPSLALERFVSQTPPHMLIAPRWNIKPATFHKMLVEYMKENNIWQGKLCELRN